MQGTLVPPKLRDEAIALLLEEREGAGAGRQLRASHTRSPASSASPSPTRHVSQQHSINMFTSSLCPALLLLYSFHPHSQSFPLSLLFYIPPLSSLHSTNHSSILLLSFFIFLPSLFPSCPPSLSLPLILHPNNSILIFHDSLIHPNLISYPTVNAVDTARYSASRHCFVLYLSVTLALVVPFDSVINLSSMVVDKGREEGRGSRRARR
jgi:hypothetical protein